MSSAFKPRFTKQLLALLAMVLLLAGSPQPASAAPRDISTVAGSGTSGFLGDSGAATSARLNTPYDVAVDGAGNLYIADRGNNRIRKVDTNGTISTVAGGGSALGDGGLAISATLSSPSGVALDSAGNLYIADTSNHRIRKVNTSGIISTVAGTGSFGFGGDGGLATSAALYSPIGVDVDGAGNIFIADTSNNRIRKVNTSGFISTVAGNGTASSTGDGGPAISAALYSPYDVAVDSAGNLFIADFNNYRIRKVTGGIISTVAGATAIYYPTRLALDGAGNLYFAEGASNSRIRKVATNGSLYTVAGTNSYGFSGDGGPATSATVAYPYGVAVDSANNVYIADTNNQRIRKVETDVPTLYITDATIYVASSSITVPVRLQGDGYGISSLAFSIDYDQTCLSLAGTDANENGIPDAVSGFPGGYVPTASLAITDTAGELDISITDQISPLVALTNTVVANLVFDIVSPCSSTDINFSTAPAPSFGNTNGNPVAGSAISGTFTLVHNAAPVAVNDLYDPTTQLIVGATLLDVLANDTDANVGDILSIASESSANGVISGTKILYTPPANLNGSEIFTYTAQDDSGEINALSNAATVTVTYVTNDLRGDCNSNDVIDAGDFSAIALEYFDTDSTPYWYHIYQAGYKGSPIGCDANASENGAFPITSTVESVSPADIVCTVLTFFGDASCTNGALLAAGAQAESVASLQVASVAANAGETVQVPVRLASGGNSIAAAGFTINYDAANLGFDATDANGDGLPDALNLNLPAGTHAWAQVSDGQIQVAVAGLRLPLPTLADGTLATATFSVTGNNSTVRLTNATLGDSNGAEVSVVTTEGTVGAGQRNVFLPLVTQ